LTTTSSTFDCESYEFTDVVVAPGKEAAQNIVKRESHWIAVNFKKKMEKNNGPPTATHGGGSGRWTRSIVGGPFI
jgi:hypothetical protein